MSDSGRIDLTNCISKPFERYENLNISNQTKYTNTGNFQTTKLSDMFFSLENIDHLQNKIIVGVYKKTDGKYKITKQSEDELVIVMKSIYLQYGKNNDTEIQMQINTLNKYVLDYCINDVYVNLQQYIKYIDDITKDQTVIDRPVNTDIKGNKTLMPNYFI
jgi:hypothetical protein